MSGLEKSDNREKFQSFQPFDKIKEDDLYNHIIDRINADTRIPSGHKTEFDSHEYLKAIIRFGGGDFPGRHDPKELTVEELRRFAKEMGITDETTAETLYEKLRGWVDRNLAGDRNKRTRPKYQMAVVDIVIAFFGYDQLRILQEQPTYKVVE